MTRQEKILQTALSLVGRTLTDGEESLLSVLCAGALKEWTNRLREDAAEEDYEEVLTVACAWTAAGGLLDSLEESQPTPLSFSAGDFSLKRQEGGAGSAQGLRKLAESLMAPYVRDGGFFFREVEG